MIEELGGIELASRVNFSNQMREKENCALKLTIFYLSTSFRGLLLTSSGAME